MGNKKKFIQLIFDLNIKEQVNVLYSMLTSDFDLNRNITRDMLSNRTIVDIMNSSGKLQFYSLDIWVQYLNEQTYDIEKNLEHTAKNFLCVIQYYTRMKLDKIVRKRIVSKIWKVSLVGNYRVTDIISP